jgi:uncharacterized protein YbjT (DUF2867 family)
MKHLILGGTGTVGSAVVRSLVDRGDEVTVVTRSPKNAQSLPEGVKVAIADLQDPSTFADTFRDLENLFLLNAVTATELQEGLVALNEAKLGGAKRLVYVSVHDVEKGAHVPHLASKIAIERAIRQSGIQYTLLQPNNFYQNDFWFKDVILGYGLYPQPIGMTGISRVDIRDIADAAVNALTSDRFANRSFALVGPQALTGADVAAEWSKALGREIRYMGDDLQAWGEQMRQFLPAWMVYDFSLMYAMFQEKGLQATPEQIDQTREITGHEPRAFSEFVAEVAPQWAGAVTA